MRVQVFQGPGPGSGSGSGSESMVQGPGPGPRPGPGSRVRVQVLEVGNSFLFFYMFSRKASRKKLLSKSYTEGLLLLLKEDIRDNTYNDA